MRRAVALLAVPILAGLTLTACGSSGGSDDAAASTPSTTATAAAAAGTIVDVAAATPELSTLVTAVKAADLATTLSGTGPFTVFAPTNAAFEKLPSGLLDQLLLPCNKDGLAKVLTYHVVPGKVTSADIKPGDVPTVEGGTVKLDTTDGVKVNNATVTQADVPASNGVVHVIDQVLVPTDVDVSALKTAC